jgi:histidyl-tRNA synthetase
MKSTIQAVKGTRDFYPEEMASRNWLYRLIRKVSESYGYQEWDGPYLEPVELYAAKSGEELVKENFSFADRGGEMITLRPELTPSLARMIAQRQKQLIFPLRWWSFGPFWRYERPQKGRAREFFQWNIDLIGVDSAIADAEIIAIAATFLQETGLTPEMVKILVNNRKLVNFELDRLGIPDQTKDQVVRLMDRHVKMPVDEWINYAKSIGLSDSHIQGLQDMLTNDNLWVHSGELEALFSSLASMGLDQWVQFSPKVIRGLDYYTGTVFEAWDSDGEFRAILGGGRYDNLIQAVGGDPVTAVGFAMGDMVATLVLKKFHRQAENLSASPAKVLVTIFDEDTLQSSLAFASELRQAGVNSACYPDISKLAKQFKYGDRMGMNYAVVLGPDEIQKKMVTIKDLLTGNQETVDRQDAIALLKSRILIPK